MSLLIDRDQIQRVRDSGAHTLLFVSENSDVPIPGPESIQVTGTTTTMPASLERARERLLSLRQNLIDSGVRPLSADELQREINESRGRS